MADDGCEFGVGHLVERVAFGEWVRLDCEIVVVETASAEDSELWQRAQYLLSS